MLRIHVINTGSELLLGNVVNTHVAYFGRKLFEIGLRIERQETLPDGSAIRDAVANALVGNDVLLVTGGLGPTSDDMTREIVAELLGLRLREDAGVIAVIQRRCEKRGIVFRERLRRQAMVPEGAVVLANENGTAPGLYLAPRDLSAVVRTPHIFLLPGPPHELHPMFEEQVLPRLEELGASEKKRAARVYRVVGMGESVVEELIGLKLDRVPGMEIGYCARPSEVDLRVIADSSLIEKYDAEIRAVLGPCLVTTENKPLEQTVVEMLLERKAGLALAESCTGGCIASLVTDVPGASGIFLEGFVTYSNEAKVRSLGVDAEVIAREGAVSEPVAAAMAQGALTKTGARYALSVTGIAGPGGGTPEKPVGTVFIGLAEEGQPVKVQRHVFNADRGAFKQLVARTALDWLRRRMLGAD